MNNQNQNQNRRPPNQGNGKQIAVRQEQHPRRIENVLFMGSEAWERLNGLARRAFKAGVLPASIKSEDAAFIVSLKGIALGLDPLYAMEHMAVINGKATIDGQAMLSLIYQRVPGAKFTVLTQTGTECEIEVFRPGHNARKVKFTFAQAHKAGLTNKPSWQNFPDQMLYWRCIGIAGRTIFPDIIGGLYPHEEMGANVGAAGEILDAEYTEHPPAESSDPSPNSPESSPQAPPAGTTPPDDDINKPSDPPTQRQLARLFAIAAEQRWTHEHVKEYIMGEFNKESTKTLSWAEYDKTVKFIQAHGMPEEGSAQ